MPRPARPVFGAPADSRHCLGRSLLVALVAVSAIAGTARAADKYAGEFLKVGAGARAMGMGGAFVSVADDASAAWWNPAGLSFLTRREVLYQHAEQFGSAVNYDYGAFVWPLSKEGERRQALAISLVRLGVDDIPVTPEADALRPGVDFVDDDRDGQWDAGERLLLGSGDLSLESANDWGMFFSYARPLGSKFTVGGSLKVVYRTLPGYAGADFSAWGAGLDAGVLYQAHPKVTLGFVARDLTTTYMSWDNGVTEHVPPSFAAAGQYTTFFGAKHAVTVGLDLPFDFEGNRVDQRFGVSADPGSDGSARGGLSGTVNLGAEYWYARTVALRTGMMGRDLSFGAGARWDGFGVDYAAVFNRMFAASDDFSGDDDLDLTHRLSGSYSF
jgi:hypothetical protein